MHYTYVRFPGGKTKAVTFSYDDGSYADVRLAKTLSDYGMKGTFNINGGRMKEDGFHLTPEQIKEHIIGRGHEVAVHGQHHKAPGMLLPIDCIEEVLECRKTLESTFGGIVRGMAYPDHGVRILMNNSSYDSVRRTLQDLGIAYARTTWEDNDTFRLPEDWYYWKPTIHHKNQYALDWAQAFVSVDPRNAYQSTRYSRLFYVWGHASEFDSAGNWDRIEALCDKFAGRDDIWCATNIEIRDYVAAYDSLRFSVDKSGVYNPSAQDVYFELDEKEYCAPAGKYTELV